MTLLVQITDTHILPPGELLHGSVDSARHLQETVQSIGRMLPKPDVVMITGDLVERGDEASYRHFIDLISPLEMPAYVIPGNHDDPQIMLKAFADTPYFPACKETFQYAVDDFSFRILTLNSKRDGTELPGFKPSRLSWLENQLNLSGKPTLLALHHPPMITGIELSDMGGSEWFQGLKSILSSHEQVKLAICGHCHIDLCGRIGQVPVYMAPATSHQLIATRGAMVAPSAVTQPGTPALHHFINGDFVSGSNPWPVDVEEHRIDKVSGRSWDDLKKSMMGSKS
jgi:Icc protein